MKEYNVLVLGATGTGKSTWINSISNYLHYETLDEALRVNDPKCLISARFTLMNENYEEILVEFGPEDENEGRELGLSCTKKPRIYTFRYENETLNIVDVPGIGDTAGVTQDEENTKMILETIGHFNELHAICIILKSTDNKLTPTYRFCLSELLMHLHKNALKNVMFVFTHTAGSDYKPGDALTPLRAYLQQLYDTRGISVPLNKDVIYCIDNEAFRFQCAYNKNPQFRDHDWQVFARSWDHGRRATLRLLQRLHSLPSVSVMETITVNEARSIILILLQPLATITALIQSNAADFDVNFDQIVMQLQQNLAVSDFDVVVEELSRPRTVCTEKKCISTEKINGSSKLTTFYRSVCHDTCYLRNVPIAKFPEPALENCEAMDLNGVCTVCGCRVERHMHIDFNQRRVIKNSRLNDAFARIDAQPTKEMAEQELRSMMENLQHEQKTVTDTMVRFGRFLRENAIFEFNNDVEERLKVEIRKEETIAQNTADRSTVDRLNAVLEDYRTQQRAIRAVMDTAGATGDGVIQPVEVVRMRDALFRLPLHGSKIEELFNRVSRTADAADLAQKKVIVDTKHGF